MNSRFPHSQNVAVGTLTVPADRILELVTPYLTTSRRLRIAEVVNQRTYSIVPVMENIYDRGNVSAVMRSAEAMGYQAAHVIELGERFKSANRVTQGADKWLDVTRWKNTNDCVDHLKERGYKIYATHLEAAVQIDEIDFSQPSAIVFGNEKDGVSTDMLKRADQRVIIPMQGFVQSYNISVAAALALYHIRQDRLRRLGFHGDLSDQEKMILTAHFCLRSSKNPERLLARLLGRALDSTRQKPVEESLQQL